MRALVGELGHQCGTRECHCALPTYSPSRIHEVQRCRRGPICLRQIVLCFEASRELDVEVHIDARRSSGSDPPCVTVRSQRRVDGSASQPELGARRLWNARVVEALEGLVHRERRARCMRQRIECVVLAHRIRRVVGELIVGRRHKRRVAPRQRRVAELEGSSRGADLRHVYEILRRGGVGSLPCRRRHGDRLIEARDRPTQQRIGRKRSAQVHRRLAPTLAEQHVGVAGISESGGYVDVSARRSSEQCFYAVGRVLRGSQRTLHVLVARRVDRIELAEFVLGEIANVDVGVVSICFVGEDGRPLCVLTVGVLEFTNGSVDDQLLERRIAELTFLDCSRIGDRESVVARCHRDGDGERDRNRMHSDRASGPDSRQSVNRSLSGQIFVSCHQNPSASEMV